MPGTLAALSGTSAAAAAAAAVAASSSPAASMLFSALASSSAAWPSSPEPAGAASSSPSSSGPAASSGLPLAAATGTESWEAWAVFCFLAGGCSSSAAHECQYVECCEMQRWGEVRMDEVSGPTKWAIGGKW